MLLDSTHSKDSGSLTEHHFEDLERAYKQVHENSRKYDVKDVFQYVSRRIESKFTPKNMMNVMSWRHEAICEPIYRFELKLHKNDEIEVLVKEHKSEMKQQES